MYYCLNICPTETEYRKVLQTKIKNYDLVTKYGVLIEGVYKVLLGKPEGRRPLGRPRRRWVDNLRWISRRWDVGIWTGLGWPRIETVGGRL